MIGQTANIRKIFAFVCAITIICSSSAESAEKNKEKAPQATQYWMSVATQNQIYPGHVR